MENTRKKQELIEELEAILKANKKNVKSAGCVGQNQLKIYHTVNTNVSSP